MATDVQPEIKKYEHTKLLLSGLVALAGVVSSFIAYKAPWHDMASADSAAVTMHVINAANDSPVRTASVRVETEAVSWNGFTDEMGNVEFRIPSAKYRGTGRVTVQADGFRGADAYFVLARDKDLRLVLVPNKVDDNGSSQASYTQIFRSGPRASGEGADFSGWYELAAPPPKPGFVIDPKQSSFELLGDRTCTSGWSQCVLSESTVSSLVWRFRMQGHNERQNSNRGIEYSETILKVTYVPRKL